MQTLRKFGFFRRAQDGYGADGLDLGVEAAHRSQQREIKLFEDHGLVHEENLLYSTVRC